MKIAIIVNFDKKGALLTASKISELLRNEGAEVYTLNSGFLKDIQSALSGQYLTGRHQAL